MLWDLITIREQVLLYKAQQGFRTGTEYIMMKDKFPFLTRVLEITVSSLEQML
jgi:hypothetical protein